MRYKHECVNDKVSIIYDTKENEVMTSEEIIDRLNTYEKISENHDWWRCKAMTLLKQIRRELIPLISEAKIRELEKELNDEIQGND